MIEADVQMKYIALGMQQPQVTGLRSHLSLLKTQGNAMQRWWAMPLYEAIYTTQDDLAFQLTGQRAQILAQEEIHGKNGQRINSPTTR